MFCRNENERYDKCSISIQDNYCFVVGSKTYDDEDGSSDIIFLQKRRLSPKIIYVKEKPKSTDLMTYLYEESKPISFSS